MQKHNADRWGNSKVDLFSIQNKTSARHLPTALFAAFFGKLKIKVKKSTRETTVALLKKRMNSLQLLPAAGERRIFHWFACPLAV